MSLSVSGIKKGWLHGYPTHPLAVELTTATRQGV